MVQARLGHASVQMTADTHGHPFPRDDGSELAAAEAFWRMNHALDRVGGQDNPLRAPETRRRCRYGAGCGRRDEGIGMFRAG